MEHLDLWRVSIKSPVNGDHSTILSSILGYEHKVGLEFLVGTGLIKHVSQVTPSYSVVQAELDRFIVEGKLQDMKSKQLFIIDRQQKFHCQVTKTLLVSHHVSHQVYERSTCDEGIDYDCSSGSEKEEDGGGNRLSSCFRIHMTLMKPKLLI